MIPLPSMHLPVSINISISGAPVMERVAQNPLFGEYKGHPEDVGAICSFERGVGCFFFAYGETPEIVAHECFHMTLRICEYIGSRLSADSEEVYAYILEFLVRECLVLLEQASPH